MNKKAYAALAAPFLIALIILAGFLLQHRSAESGVASVIDAEAEGLVARDYTKILAVYDDSATIVEAPGLGRDRQWSGKYQITDKYRSTLRLQKFKQLDHVNKEIFISGDTAVVVSGAKGEYLQWQGPLIKVDAPRSEKWTLRRKEGRWNVVRYVFGDDALKR